MEKLIDVKLGPTKSGETQRLDNTIFFYGFHSFK